MISFAVELIITNTVDLITENYNNDQISFYSWIHNSDYDIQYIYEKNFNQFYNNVSYETRVILDYYSYNTYCAMVSFYEINTSLCTLTAFIKIFIFNQFKNADQDQLFLEN